MNIAYYRVSSIDQNTASQKEAMKNIEIDKVYEEKISGKDMERPQLKEMLDYVREGDTIYCYDFSRISRSLKDLLDIIDLLEKKNVRLVSLRENLDTHTPTGRLMLGVIGSVNQFQREIQKEKQMIGTKIAKEQGKFKGKQAKPIDEELFQKNYALYTSRKINKKQLCENLNVSFPTLQRILKNKGLLDNE